MSPGQCLGERFARAVADHDTVGLKALLAPNIDFRAMTPGKFWEAGDVDVIVEDTILGTWFGGERKVAEILAIETDSLSSVDRVGYRFLVELPEGEFAVEQQAYFKTEGERMSWLRIMCTGFLPLVVAAQ